mmetsp:Transcript_12409/g.37290  ORF Transcript_12409/g.37290 Transcript_12409/m.37290 type:complete len:231 (-) Transcript_12409:572-1264(-)
MPRNRVIVRRARAVHVALELEELHEAHPARHVPRVVLHELLEEPQRRRVVPELPLGRGERVREVRVARREREAVLQHLHGHLVLAHAALEHGHLVHEPRVARRADEPTADQLRRLLVLARLHELRREAVVALGRRLHVALHLGALDAPAQARAAAIAGGEEPLQLADAVPEVRVLLAPAQALLEQRVRRLEAPRVARHARHAPPEPPVARVQPAEPLQNIQRAPHVPAHV